MNVYRNYSVKVTDVATFSLIFCGLLYSLTTTPIHFSTSTMKIPVSIGAFELGYKDVYRLRENDFSFDNYICIFKIMAIPKRNTHCSKLIVIRQMGGRLPWLIVSYDFSQGRTVNLQQCSSNLYKLHPHRGCVCVSIE